MSRLRSSAQRWRGLLHVFLLVPAFAIVAYGQTSQITGRVADPSGAVIPGAAVVVTNTDTGIERVVSANAQGYYTATLLTRGTYRVQAESDGFKPTARTNQTLDEGQILRLDFVLEVGQVTEVVEVVGSTPLLQTEDTSMATVMPNRKITDLPLAGRNPQVLVALAPGVRPIGAFGGMPVSSFDGSRMSIGGGSPSGNNIQVDGIAAENFTSGGLQTYLSVDATEEFRLVTRNPSAEHGRTGGGVLNFISKSGTNEFHGSGYWFHRNKALNANDYFSNASGQDKAPLVFNQWGATLGGPIKRDKTFFFFNYEEFRERTLSRTFRTLPTALQRAGDFSQTFDRNGNTVLVHDPLTTTQAASGGRVREAFANNVIPGSRIHPVSAAAAAYWPSPTSAGDPVTNTNNFFGQASQPLDQKVLGLKIDHNFTPERRFSARYTYNRTKRLNPVFYDNIGEIDGGWVRFIRDPTAFSYTDSLRPNLLLEARAGVNGYGLDRPDLITDFDVAELGLPSSLNTNLQKQVFPEFLPADVSGIGSSKGFKQTNWTWNWGANLTWIKGSHTVKFGGEERIYQNNNDQGGPSLRFNFARNFTRGPNPNNTAANSGHGVATMLLGTPTAGQVRRWPTTTYTAKYYGFFIQDDWKATRKLTLNLGLRYEYDGAVTDRFNAISNFDPDLLFDVDGVQMRGAVVHPGSNGLSRGHRHNWKTDFGPRFGFAYQASPSMVVRGGYGLYYLPATGNFVRLGQTGFALNTELVSSVDGGFTPNDTLDNPFPNGIGLPPGAALGPLTGLGTSAEGNARNLSRATSQQWNLNIQKQFAGGWMTELGYSGNRGTHLGAATSYDFLPEQFLALGTALQEQVDNPYYGVIPAGTLAQPTVSRGALLDTFPQFLGTSNAVDHWASSIYHAFTARIERRFASGFSVLSAYTWSKLIDDNLGNGVNNFADSGNNGVQNWSDRRAERAISTSNQPHRLTVAGLWELPFGKTGPKAVRAIAGGWQVNSLVTLASGNVISITQSAVPFGGNRPNVVGDPKLDNPDIEQWFNADAFSPISAFTFGNAPRNLPRTRTDSLFNLDLSIFKNIRLMERATLQLRGEFFNLTNTPTFGNPGSNALAGNFGVVRSLAPNTLPRRIQFGAKILF